jgi:HAD superfamily hydrolase (TIGR01509 family)
VTDPPGPEQPLVRAVVFDLDGVLIDSEPVWEAVRRRVVEESGGHWAPDAQARLMGMSTGEWSRYLSVDLGVGLPPAQVADLVIERVADAYTAHLPLVPSATSVVRSLAACWPLGLASSSPRRLIDTVLDGSELRELFTVAVSTEEVPRGKPAPDVYLAAADRLAVPPGRCVAVEDSTNGVRAADAAGMPCVAVPQPRYPVPPEVLSRATRVLPSLGDLTVDVVASIGQS